MIFLPRYITIIHDIAYVDQIDAEVGIFTLAQQVSKHRLQFQNICYMKFRLARTFPKASETISTYIEFMCIYSCHR